MNNKQLFKKAAAICLVSAMAFSNIVLTPNNRVFNTDTPISAEEIQTLAISTLSAGNGTVTASKSTVNFGEAVTIQITANTNYELSKVVVNGQEQAVSANTVSTLLTIPACYINYTIYAEFTRPSYAVTTSNNGNGTVTANSTSVLKGDKVTILAVPDSGYFVKSISVNGNTVLTNDVNAETFTNGCELQDISFDVKAQVTFEKINQSDISNVTINSGANGTVTPSTYSFKNGSDISFNVKANDSYKISSIKVNGIPQTIADNLFSIDFKLTSVTGDINIEAAFEEIHYNVNVTKTGNGTVSMENASLKRGEEFSLSFTPDSGYSVKDVIVNGKSYGAIKGFDVKSIETNYDVQVIFAPTQNIEYTLTILPSSNGTVTPSAYTVTGGQSISISFTPNAGYKVSKIILDDKVYETEGSGISLDDIHSNHTIQVIFTQISSQAVVGDINGDNAVTTADILMLKKQLCGKLSLISASDINKDGVINIFDLITLAKIIISGK